MPVSATISNPRHQSLPESLSGTLPSAPNAKPQLITFSELMSLPHVEKSFSRGAIIYSSDTPARYLYQIISGRVKSTCSSLTGQNRILSIHHRGDLFGEQSLLSGYTLYRDAAVTLETTRIAIFRTEDFWRVYGNDPRQLQEMLQYTLTRLAAAHQQIESQTFDHNHRRLAQALLQEYEKAMHTGESCVRLTHEELAELIGSVREVVTSLMIEMRHQGLLEYQRGCVYPQVTKLRRFLLTADSPSASEFRMLD
jgi:CRP/FNR family transcriptional regulator